MKDTKETFIQCKNNSKSKSKRRGRLREGRRVVLKNINRNESPLNLLRRVK